jgi:parvulin-like peptidyl-prolyl isomerase
VVDDELSRLPDKYRAPLVLCYLQGLTNAEAARQLHWPAGTLKTRLTHARRLLADRLARRGLGMGLSSVLLPGAAPAVVKRELVNATVRAAALVAEKQGMVAGVVSAPVARLMEGVLQTMTLTRLKLAVVILVAGLTLGGGGLASYRALGAGSGQAAAAESEEALGRVERLKQQISELQGQLRQAEKAAFQERVAAQDPVARIFGDVPITRAELGEYLIRRLSRPQLEAYINQRILEHACRRRGIVVTDQEVEDALKRDQKTLHANGPRFEEVLRQYRKTLTEWREDVIRPRLLLEKLCREQVQVTEQDLQDAYEAAYGEKVECVLIHWPQGEKDRANRAVAMLRENPAAFERLADCQSNASLAANHGHVAPFSRHTVGHEELERAAFRLQPGEISPLVETPEGLAVLKCLRRIPADPSQTFAQVRDSLRREVRERLIQKESSRVFQELKEAARPRFLWRPDEIQRLPAP